MTAQRLVSFTASTNRDLFLAPIAEPTKASAPNANPSRKKGAEGHKLHQHRIDREDGVPLTRALHGEEAESEQKDQRADHNVAVDRKGLGDFAPGADRRPGPTACIVPKQVEGDPQSDKRGCDLGDQRARRNPGHTPAKAQNKERIKAGIYTIQEDLEHHRKTRLLHTDKPAQHGIVREGKGRTPHADRKIGLRFLFHCVAALHKLEGNPVERELQREKPNARDTGNDKGTPERRANFNRIIRPESLRSEAGRSHAQEPKCPEEKGENKRAHSDGADERGIAQLPDHRRIHDPEQRG